MTWAFIQKKSHSNAANDHAVHILNTHHIENRAVLLIVNMNTQII